MFAKKAKPGKKPSPGKVKESDGREWYHAIVKDMNRLARSNDHRATICAFLHEFATVHIPRGCRTTRVDWVLDFNNPNLHGKLVVLAHSNETKRAIAILRKSDEGKIAPYLSYRCHVQIVKSKSVIIDKKRKIRQFYKKVDDDTKKPPLLFTGKRGWWMIWKPSLEAGITDKNMAKHESTVIDWYEKYIVGMDQPPPDTVARVKEDFKYEQFMLDTYPTPEWKAITMGYKKKNVKRIRFVGEAPDVDYPGVPPPPPDSEEEEEEEEESEEEEEKVIITEEELKSADFQKLREMFKRHKTHTSEIETPTGIQEGGDLVFVNPETLTLV